MKRVKVIIKKKIIIENILGFIKRKVTPFGTSAKVDCPKEFLSKTVYLVITDE